jgi:hypothetical protein
MTPPSQRARQPSADDPLAGYTDTLNERFVDKQEPG